MPIQLQGYSGVVAEVDGSVYRALHVVSRPIDHGAFGSYQISNVSGTIGAALAASAVVFTARWGDATRLAVITELKVEFQCLTPFTAGTLTDFGFDAFIGRTYTASFTNQTNMSPSGNSWKTRASMGTSLMTDVRISATAAITGGTVTVDSHPFASSLGDAQRVNPAAGTEEQRVNDPTLWWRPDIASGQSPIILAQNEGIVVRNRAVWPAAGTGIIAVHMRWAEVADY